MIAVTGRLPYYQITSLRKPTLKRKIEQLRESGVVLLIGIDSGIPLISIRAPRGASSTSGPTTWTSLRWMQSAPLIGPSVLMKVEKEVGTVSEGKYADVIAVRGDVLRHIDLLQHVDIIIRHGKRYK